jgi:cobalt-zinc-cadmium efflux system protein
VVSALVIQKTNWLWLDPTVSLVIAIVIVTSTWYLLKDSLNLALAGVPRHIQIDKVRSYLEKIQGVSHVHDLHIWGLSTTDVALTAHLVMPEGSTQKDFLKALVASIKNEFEIQHVTIQIEPDSPQDPCCSLEHE